MTLSSRSIVVNSNYWLINCGSSSWRNEKWRPCDVRQLRCCSVQLNSLAAVMVSVGACIQGFRGDFTLARCHTASPWLSCSSFLALALFLWPDMTKRPITRSLSLSHSCQMLRSTVGVLAHSLKCYLSTNLLTLLFLRAKTAVNKNARRAVDETEWARREAG